MAKAKMVSMEGLTPKQKATMKKHSVHHSQSHMKYMVGVMRNGKSFKQAHNLAMKKVGK